MQVEEEGGREEQTFDKVAHQHLHPPGSLRPGPKLVRGHRRESLVLFGHVVGEELGPLLPITFACVLGRLGAAGGVPHRHAPPLLLHPTAMLDARAQGHEIALRIAAPVPKQLAEEPRYNGRVHSC